MTDLWLSIAFPAAVMLLVLVSLMELVLSAVWAPFYFRYGIPLLRRRYAVPADLELGAAILQLEQNLLRSWWRPAVVFRRLGPTELAFRNRFGSRNPLQGLVRLEPGYGRLTITGNLFSAYLLFPLLMLLFFLGGGVPVLFFLLFTAVFSLILGMQRRHYAEIAGGIAATLGALPGGDTAVSSPPRTTNLPEAWAGSAYDPLATNKPQTGLSRLELALIVILLALVGAIGWFLFGLFSAV